MRKKFILLYFSASFLLLIVLNGVDCLIFPQIQYSQDDDLFHGGGMRFRRNARAFRGIGGSQREVLIPANYNVFETPPTPNDEPNRVNLSIIILGIRGISEKDEQITLEMNMRMFWRDPRLQHLASAADNETFVVLNPNLLSEIWHPDIFIDHAIAVTQPSVITKPASLRIYPESVIRYSSRLSVTVSCRMMFKYYPLDTQRCRVELKSYAYPNKIIELGWKEQKGSFLAYQLNIPNFDVELDQNKNRNFTTRTSSAVYSILEFTIKLERHISYHLIQTYLPSLIFLTVSWLSFLIPKECVPERVGCSMMTLLALTVMYGAVGQRMPNVSYLTALHIWMATCIVFVFFSLMEFTVVLKLVGLEKAAALESTAKLSRKSGQVDRRYENGIEMKQNNSPVTLTTDNEDSITVPGSPPHPPPPPSPASELSLSSPLEKKYNRIIKNLEYIAPRALPSLFLCFNLIYWPWLYIYC